uniref:Uncharacterized protein n=1 Tax=Triticum aestivum TaxID=4565 RepID=A0A3B6MNP4_WHEAT
MGLPGAHPVGPTLGLSADGPPGGMRAADRRVGRPPSPAARGVAQLCPLARSGPSQRLIWPPVGFPRASRAPTPASHPAASQAAFLVPSSRRAPSPPPPPPAMTREWGDAESRPKRRADDRRDPPRSSPDGLRREADLRSQLTSRPARRSPARDSRDPRRSPSRQSRRSPTRDDRRSHSPARRDPPREDSRDRGNSPARRSPARGRSPTRRSPARDGRGYRRPSPP